MLDVVPAGLLMLKEVLDSLLVDEMKLVIRKGVEPNVAGFKLVVVVNESISVDEMAEDNEDKR